MVCSLQFRDLKLDLFLQNVAFAAADGGTILPNCGSDALFGTGLTHQTGGIVEKFQFTHMSANIGRGGLAASWTEDNQRQEFR